MTTRPPNLSDSEQEVLKALWDQGQATVRELNELLAGRGRQWAYTTVQTLLTRLQQKGYVESIRAEPAHFYRPLVSRDQLLEQRLTELEDELCEGVRTPLVHALVSGKKFTPEEIAHFRQLLDELESKADDQSRKTTRLRKPKR